MIGWLISSRWIARSSRPRGGSPTSGAAPAMPAGAAGGPSMPELQAGSVMGGGPTAHRRDRPTPTSLIRMVSSRRG